MRLFYLYWLIIICGCSFTISLAQNIEIYEYKNANGVTVFTNNPDKLKTGAKIAPMAVQQIYSEPAINKNQKRQNNGNIFIGRENVVLNDDGRKKILEQEYNRELKILTEEQNKLNMITQSNSSDKQQIKEISDNITQHKDNINILKSQIRSN